jgi:hypothetical protein
MCSGFEKVTRPISDVAKLKAHNCKADPAKPFHNRYLANSASRNSRDDNFVRPFKEHFLCRIQ